MAHTYRGKVKMAHPHTQSRGVDFFPRQGHLEGAEAHGARACCHGRSSSGAASFTLRAAIRVVLHLQWSSSVAARA